VKQDDPISKGGGKRRPLYNNKRQIVSVEYFGEDHFRKNNPSTSDNYCRMQFEDAIFRFESDSDKNETRLEILPAGATEYVECIKYPMAIEYAVHYAIASGGHIDNRRKIEINRIMFYDNEPVDEEEQEEIEKEGRVFDAKSEKISDLLISGNLNSALFADEKVGR